MVIPTHDRPAGLARLLTALGSQSLAAERFEVIVVDDGSAVSAGIAGDGPALRVIRHEWPRGPGAARNSGWRVATTPIVAFIDDDCVPTPGWLEAVLAAARSAGEEVVIQGRVEPMPDQRAHLNPLSHTIEVTGASRLFVSANIVYPRSLLEHLGGFDERFARAGEDADLGARAVKAGARATFAPDALVHHEVRGMSLRDHVRHTLKWTDAVGAVAIHPELRTLLTLRLFWKPTHLWLLAGAAAVVRRRPLLAAAAAVPYVAHYRRLYEGDSRALARALPAHLAIDVCEIATAVAGSARHRTLML